VVLEWCIQLVLVSVVIHQHANSSAFKSARKSAREVLGHSHSLKILVILNPAGYMLASSEVPFIHLRRYILLWMPLKRSVILLKSPTSTGGYSSNSTSSSVTNRPFFPSSGPKTTCACWEEVYWRWNELLASREATSFFAYCNHSCVWFVLPKMQLTIVILILVCHKM
jgi:hypothetical protein